MKGREGFAPILVDRQAEHVLVSAMNELLRSHGFMENGM